jgi:hypothetical protein
MKQQPKIEPTPPWQDRIGQIQRNPVQIESQQVIHPQVNLTHQCQGRQEMPAKLPVSHPWPAWNQFLERKAVDLLGNPIKELDVG